MSNDMRPFRITRWAALVVMCLVSRARADDEVPPDAQQVIAEFDKKATALAQKAEADLQRVQEAAVAKLKVLQDQYCRAAKLDAALAVREQIRRIIGLRPDPGVLHLTAEDLGKTLLFDVIGSTEGSVWGTEVFTGDSHLAAAAVHSGVLKPGQRGAVRVRVIAGQKGYEGSTKNGVESQPYGPWGVSFTVGLGPALP